MIKEQKPTVFVVDDDAAVRDSLRLLLKSVGLPVEVFESAQDFLDAERDDRPGCLVLDIRMPGMSGLELQGKLNERHSILPIIFITGHGDVPMAVNTMKKGAVDFIEKPFDQAALKALVDRLLVEARENAAANERQKLSEALLAKLTPREEQVLERIVAGRLNKQIADDLGISIKTVEAHRANIMDKVNANTVADLMRIVLSGGALKSS